ncbi:MAG: FAD-dependent oxidoreductase, partial [Clostridiales bacterium]|nr:FAD-dependent oxidoreductase [Clostridiales bacterium]
GGGAVGLELATLYSGLGSKVTVLEFMPEILPSEDHETVALLRNLLNQSGIAIKTSCSVTEIRKDNEEYIIDYECDGKTAHDAVDLVITAVGRVPYTDDLNLDGIVVELDDKGFIRTNNFLETTAQGVYAAGDVIGGMLLAHVAFAEGKTAVENALGEKKPHEAISVPRCIFTHPEFSAVGLTEEAVQDQGLDYRVGRFPLRGNGRAVSLGQNQGLVKVIVDSQIGQILGVSIVGPCASEMIASASYLIEEEFTCSELGTTMIAHPTLGEALKEAGLDCYGLAIHK